MDKIELTNYFKDLSYKSSNGLEAFLSENGKDEVFRRLGNIENEPLSKVQLNQLLILSRLTGISFGFFKYYWLTAPIQHTYDVKKVEDYDESSIVGERINSIRQLRWGFRRIYIDTLLYFGNITHGFNRLNNKTEEELIQFFKKRRFPTEKIKMRGEPLEFQHIEKLDRYLISEMACKTYEAPEESEQSLKQFMLDNYSEAKKKGRVRITVKELFSKDFVADAKKKYENNLLQLEFSAEDLLEKEISKEDDINKFYDEIAKRFFDARKKALQNTKYYLSLVHDLDVYVATSMRSKQDFMDMADTCERVFKDTKIKKLHPRYFDPTISAANSHEDKGIIECLMVHCAKILIYSAGLKDSYGKDAEAAMALSSGKPVIFYCTDGSRGDFYKKVHPLAKLIDFSTGVANGAIVTFNIQEVVEVLSRIFENNMEYAIRQPKEGYFKLVELTTESDIRIQTNDELLSKSFWNYFERIIKD